MSDGVAVRLLALAAAFGCVLLGATFPAYPASFVAGVGCASCLWWALVEWRG